MIGLLQLLLLLRFQRHHGFMLRISRAQMLLHRRRHADAHRARVMLLLLLWRWLQLRLIM